MPGRAYSVVVSHGPISSRRLDHMVSRYPFQPLSVLQVFSLPVTLSFADSDLILHNPLNHYLKACLIKDFNLYGNPKTSSICNSILINASLLYFPKCTWEDNNVTNKIIRRGRKVCCISVRFHYKQLHTLVLCGDNYLIISVACSIYFH